MEPPSAVSGRLRQLAPGLGAVVAVGGLALGAALVWQLERGELELRGAPTLLEETDGERHRELGRAALHAGEDVVFEVCADDRLDPERWADKLDLVVWHIDEQALVMRATVDRALLAGARRSPRGACILLAEGRELPVGGVYAVEAVWAGRALPAALRRVPLVARILARRPLDTSALWPLGLVLVGVLIAALAGLRRAPLVPTTTSHPLRALAGGVATLALTLFALAWMPFGGASFVVARGVTIALSQLLAAWWFARLLGAPSRAQALAVEPPGPKWTLLLMPAAGAALWMLGSYVARLIPATGEAPIETLVAWPSGALALALIALTAPIAEEIFFRGLLFGALAERLGGAGAFAATVLLFTVVHLPQTWGAWGALASIATAAIGFTAIRWRTGSSLAAALAHLTHNALISVGGLLSSLAS